MNPLCLHTELKIPGGDLKLPSNWILGWGSKLHANEVAHFARLRPYISLCVKAVEVQIKFRWTALIGSVRWPDPPRCKHDAAAAALHWWQNDRAKAALTKVQIRPEFYCKKEKKRRKKNWCRSQWTLITHPISLGSVVGDCFHWHQSDSWLQGHINSDFGLSTLLQILTLAEILPCCVWVDHNNHSGPLGETQSRIFINRGRDSNYLLVKLCCQFSNIWTREHKSLEMLLRIHSEDMFGFIDHEEKHWPLQQQH